jgi:transcriptional regulator with XRE-family HTH domain
MESDFKKNLRAELDYLDLTVKELSAKTGVAKGTLDCYLGTRASMPPADIAVKIADALGISVEYLVTGKETKNKEALPVVNPAIRSIIAIILKLDEGALETMLNLVRILKNQAEKLDTSQDR